MSFSFGFSGDDIEEDPNDAQTSNPELATPAHAGNAESNASNPPLVEATVLDVDELLSTLPSKLSYQTLTITSPAGMTASIPRRELFDIRLQIMAEDDNVDASTAPLTGLDDSSDIKTNVYEGGFKSWECAFDLVRFLMERGPRKDLDDLWRVGGIVEMGCGTALPSLLLFQHALKSSIPLYLTLTDYNASVLRLVTLPNLLLTFASTLPATSAPFSESSPNPLLWTPNGDLDITPDLISAFKTALAALPITLTLISGSWTPVSKFLELVPSEPEMNTFVIASETIYSPASMVGFTEAMTGLLKRVRSGKALVGAKRVYFGVGGSVDGFREECARRGAVAYEVEFEGLGEGGVRRCILEVQMC